MATDDDDLLWGYSTREGGPEWRPLTDLLGPHLATFFLWMNAMELFEDGRAHAYRHTAAGNALDIHADGRTLEYVGGGEYAAVHPVLAVRRAFAGWESCGPQDQDEQTMHELRLLHDRLVTAHGPATDLEPWWEKYGVAFPRLNTTDRTASRGGSTSATLPPDGNDPTEDAA